MPIINAAQAPVKTVGDPNAAYESLKPIWNRCRAVCSGEKYVKEFDSVIDTLSFTNLLIPFSPSMTQKQFDFYKAEAELPGITASFSKMIIGSLLRKKPVLELPDDFPSEISDWINNEFGKDDSSLTSFLDSALNEEIQTSRAWIFVDYPELPIDSVSLEEKLLYKPYPILQKAEAIINWRVRQDAFGRNVLDRIVVRGYEEEFDKNEFHPTFRDTVWVHELDDQGFYQIRIYKRVDDTVQVPVIAGQQYLKPSENKQVFQLVETKTNILINGERLTFIPAWPLNGSIEALEPVLSPIIDKELHLYNKISRRNHLLYGAATYTTLIASDMTDDQFEEIVGKGLGSWIKLRQGDTATVLATPTQALIDMDRAIAASIEEMAKLGVRMLTPETNQSGIALEIRNAAQAAQLGTLNAKVSSTMSQVIAFMINWRFDTNLRASDVKFELAPDFNKAIFDANWMRLATEWYQLGLIPRSAWIMLLKQHNMLPPEYNDEEGREEITEDVAAVMNMQNPDYAKKIAEEQESTKFD